MVRRFSTWASAVVVALLGGAACGGGPTDPGGGGGGSGNPPVITCPSAPPPVTSPTGQPVNVSYGAAIVSGTGVSVTCAPPSGATFPVGTTAVVCTATDSIGRTAACSFTITVQSAPRLALTGYAAFGDSITWGEDGTDFCTSTFVADSAVGRIRPHRQLPTAQQYPAVLQGLLQARYAVQPIRVDGLGLQGEAAAEAFDRFTRVVINPHIYQAVLLMEGANDINRLASPSGGINGLRAMIEAAKAAGLRPFLATIPPEIEGRYY